MLDQNKQARYQGSTVPSDVCQPEAFDELDDPVDEGLEQHRRKLGTWSGVT